MAFLVKSVLDYTLSIKNIFCTITILSPAVLQNGLC